MFLMKEFLTKLRNYKQLKRYSKMNFQQKFWKKTQSIFYILSRKHKFLYWELDYPVWFKSCRCNPAFKKKSKTSKDNYRPISILSNIYKIYERCLYNQIHTYFDEILSKYQCGFRKGFNAQHYLVSMIEKWKESLDNNGAFGALITDFSKTFECLHYGLLIAKLDVYSFDIRSV